MTATAQIEKREKSVVEMLVVIMLFSTLMAIFINRFMAHQEQIASAGVEVIANNFFSKVNVVRSQWFMDKKPTIVTLVTMNDREKSQIPVNQWGWVDTNTERLACEKIWQLVLATPMEFMQAPVSVIEIKSSTEEQARVCQYNFSNGMFFEYHSLTGQVVK